MKDFSDAILVESPFARSRPAWSLTYSVSDAGAEFEVVESALEEPVKGQYSTAARMWNQLRREFLYAIEQATQIDEEAPKKGNMLWRFFWASQQRFFRHMCMAAKVSHSRLGHSHRLS